MILEILEDCDELARILKERGYGLRKKQLKNGLKLLITTLRPFGFKFEVKERKLTIKAPAWLRLIYYVEVGADGEETIYDEISIPLEHPLIAPKNLRRFIRKVLNETKDLDGMVKCESIELIPLDEPEPICN